MSLDLSYRKQNIGAAIFTITALQRRVFELLLATILLFDLFAQDHYLRGPLFHASFFTAYAPWVGLCLVAVGLFLRKIRIPALLLLAILHYAITYSNGQLYSEADTWIWLMTLAFVCIPDHGEKTESYWVGVLKLIGFLVYFFAGLQKMVHHEWWTGEALVDIFANPVAAVNKNYLFMVKWPWLAQALCWVTLLQRLVVPWGFWSNRLLVRRLAAGTLAVMHYCYMMSLNIGIFSWVGILYLSLYFFPDHEQTNYYKLPPRPKSLTSLAAALAALYLVILSSLNYADALGYGTDKLVSKLEPTGFMLNWAMFAHPPAIFHIPVYSLKTCNGQEFSEDQIYWDYGTSEDYFRRRFLKKYLHIELTASPALGPIERSLLAHLPVMIAERRVQLFTVSASEQALTSDTGYQIISNCKNASSVDDPNHHI